MTGKSRAVDIRELPEVARLVDEMCSSNEPVVLHRGGEEVAQIVPIRGRVSKKTPAKTAADYEEFLSSAGAWEDVDTDSFLAANRESRDRSIGPAVDL